MNWTSVNEQMPETNTRVIGFWKNVYDKNQTSCVKYIAPNSVLAEDFLDSEFSEGFAEYDEEKDCYWTPEGFYESNYETDVNFFISEKVTHWMPLPKTPELNESAKVKG